MPDCADMFRQGDVYLKIIEEVVQASMNDFEESGVGQGTLNELQQVSSLVDLLCAHLRAPKHEEQERRCLQTLHCIRKRAPIVANVAFNLWLSRAQLGNAGSEQARRWLRAAAGL